jgi:uncharacterized repeat protein (TIGR03803 family)
MICSRSLHAFALAASVLPLLSACGGGGGDDASPSGQPVDTHLIGGTVTGLAATTRITLSLGSETLTLDGDGAFQFSTPVPDQGRYAVQISGRPVGQTCTLSGATGTATAQVNTVQVSCPAPAYSVLYAFGAHDVAVVGGAPWGQVVQTPNGRLFGLAMVGGNGGGGTAFSLGLDGSFTLLHTFGSEAHDGITPLSSPTLATDGTVWGTTGYNIDGSWGTVFRMGTDGTVLTRIALPSNGEAGLWPMGRLLVMPNGDVVGTNNKRGANACGTVFRATPAGVVSVLHAFKMGEPHSGCNPRGGVSLGPDGFLYGTTYNGGLHGHGTLFKLSTDGVLTVLHAFGDPLAPDDGWAPYAATPLWAQDGQLYGTTSQGGAHGGGTVYRLSPNGAFTVLHAFGDPAVPHDGQGPVAGLIQGSDGHFYGVTASGGRYSMGALFKMDRNGAVTVLHDFADPTAGVDGFTPVADLIQGEDGHLYGTTRSGGTGDGGAVFRY